MAISEILKLPLLDVNHMCEIYGLSSRSLWQARRKGQIPECTLRLGKQPRWTRQVVLAHLGLSDD